MEADDTALRRAHELRLQRLVDRLVAAGTLDPGHAGLERSCALDGFARGLGERAVLGCGHEALRRQARQQARRAQALACEAREQFAMAAELRAAAAAALQDATARRARRRSAAP
jgi:hypothetical protein